jgi:uncharacterized membrane protein YgcG
VFSRLVVLVALAAGLVFVGVSVAATGPSQEGGSAVMSHLSRNPGSTTVTITIQASCLPYAGASDPQDWSWSVAAGGTYPDGTNAFETGWRGIQASPGATTGSEQVTETVGLEHPDDESETITWVALLSCGADPEYTLGAGTFTVTKSGSGGSGSGGSGRGGSGGGGSGSGGSGCVVPELVGKTLTAARKLLKLAHCRLGKVTGPRASPGVVRLVRSSSPPAGTSLPSGTKVDVKVRKA